MKKTVRKKSEGGRFGLTKAQVSMLSGRHLTAFRILSFVADRGERGATCDEALVELRLTHQAGSVRFSELVHAGLMQDTGKRRKTRSNATASVVSAKETADFRQYVLTKPSLLKALSKETDEAVLEAGRRFVRAWPVASTVKRQRGLILTLVETLQAVATKAAKHSATV